jgi:trimeric autotransporter adhesin
MDTSGLIISTRSGLSAIVLGSLFALVACGAGGSQTVTNSPTLVSIQVSTPNANLTVGDSEQVTATGKYSDKTSKNLTSSVSWTTSPAGLATVAAGGVLTAQSSGTVSITATMSSVSGSVSLTIAPKLVSMTIAPTSATIASSTKQQFIATGTFSDDSVQTITGSVSWSSSKPAFATISDTSPTKGLATGVSAGTTTITATSGSISVTASLTVTSASATSLAITPNPASMALFVSQQFTATAQFSDGTSQDVTNVATWSSSSTTTASVTASGVVSAKKTTTTPVTISAAFESQSASTPLTITADNLNSISILPQGGIAPGTKVQFTATGTFDDGSTHNLTTQVTWASSDTTVLKFLSTTGSTAQGFNSGTVTVTASLGSVVGSESFNVSSATIQSVTVTPSKPTIAIGGHQSFTATGLFSDSTAQDITTSVTWNVSDTSVASIGTAGSTIGVANGLNAGTANVTAAFSGVTGMTLLTVSSATLQSIAVTPKSSLVVPASNEQLNATGTFTDGSTQVLNQNVTWSETDTSGSNVATVGTTGIVTGQSAGTANVTAKSGSISGSASLAVEGSALKSIQVSSQSTSVPETIQLPFTATGLFADSNKLDLTSVVTWTSSAPAVATVSNAPNSDGVATGVAMGSTTIAASFQGQSDSANLTVTNATLVSITVTPANPSISLGSTQQFTATGSFTQGPDINITNQVAWSSTDPAVAVIKTSGVAVSAATGTTTIKASLNGVNGTTVLTVH